MDRVDEVGRLLEETKRKFGLIMRSNFHSEHLTITQAIVTHHVHTKGQVKISDLSHVLGLSNSTVSGIVDRLENLDILKRVRSKEDKRIVYVELSKGFDKKKEDMSSSFSNAMKELFCEVDEKELDTIVAGLTALNNVLDIKKDKETN